MRPNIAEPAGAARETSIVFEGPNLRSDCPGER